MRRLAAPVLLEDQLEWFVLRLLGLGGADHVVVHHGIEHDRLPGERPVLVQRRVEIAGAVRQAGEQRGLPEGQILGVLPEIDLGGGLDAGRPVPVIDAVQVQPQDLVLAVPRFQGGRHHGLAQLAQDRLLGRLQDRDLGQLLGDRAGALLRAASDDIDDAGLDDAAPVDAMVLVEVPVLHRDRRVAEIGTDFVQLDRDYADALRVALLDQSAMAVDDLDVAAREVQPAGIGEGGEGIREGAEDQQQDQDRDDADQRHPVAPDLQPVEPILQPAARPCGRGAPARRQ